ESVEGGARRRGGLELPVRQRRVRGPRALSAAVADSARPQAAAEVRAGNPPVAAAAAGAEAHSGDRPDLVQRIERRQPGLRSGSELLSGETGGLRGSARAGQVDRDGLDDPQQDAGAPGGSVADPADRAAPTIEEPGRTVRNIPRLAGSALGTGGSLCPPGNGDPAPG